MSILTNLHDDLSVCNRSTGVHDVNSRYSAVDSRYNALIIRQETHNRHPIARLQSDVKDVTVLS